MCVQLSVTPWTIARLTPLSMRFSQQKYWGGLPCSLPGDLSNPGIEPASPALQVNSLLLSHQGSAIDTSYVRKLRTALYEEFCNFTVNITVELCDMFPYNFRTGSVSVDNQS